MGVRGAVWGLWGKPPDGPRPREKWLMCPLMSTCNPPQCSRPQEGTESWLLAQVSQEGNTCTHTCGGRQQKGMPLEGLACSKECGERSRWHPDGRTRKTQKEEMAGGLQQPVSVLSLGRGEALRPLCEASRKKAGGWGSRQNNAPHKTFMS